MMKIVNRTIRCILILVAVLILLVALPPTRVFVSMGMMMLNNAYHSDTTLMKEKGIRIDMPAGRIDSEQSWYPFMLVFNADDYFSRIANKELELTILYNYPAFDPLTGRSHIYVLDSSYNGAFYGAYLVECENNPYGFLIDDEGNLVEGDLLLIGSFDYTRLVLRDLGAAFEEISFEQELIDKGVESLADYDDWIRVTARVKTQSPTHGFNGFRLNYLQYGFPEWNVSEDFPDIDLYSRVWIRRFEDKNTLIVLYAMTPELEFLEDMSEKLIHETIITLD